MARRRSKTSATGGNMDSLLDALTNVVGILVIVLVAVQLSSQEAARRMEEMISKVDPAEQERIDREAEEAKERLAAAMKAIEKEQKREKVDPEKELKALLDDLAAAQKKAQEDRLAAEKLEKENEKAKLEAEKLQKQLMAQLAQLEEKAKEYTVSRDDLMAQLKQTRIPVPPPPKEVRPPTPQPAPVDMQTGKALLQERIVLVRKGKIIPFIDVGKENETIIKKKIEGIIQFRNLPITKDNWMPNAQVAEVVIKEFNKNPPKLRNFKPELVLNGTTIQVKLTPEDDAGETPAQAIKGWFRRAVYGTSRTYFLNYLVEPDSFEEYIAIRKATDNEGFFAGWKPIPEGFERTLSVGFNAGEKPPPPKPNPNPGKPGPVSNVLD